MKLRLVAAIILLLAIPLSAFADAASTTREFLDGHRKVFSTKGHVKAKGVSFTMAYPSSWAGTEGERPNIVQRFVSDNGCGREVAMILTKELPLPPDTVITWEEQEEVFSPSELRGMVPPGATFVDAQSTAIEGNPAGILEYTVRSDRAGMSLFMHTWTMNFLCGQTFVQVEFAVGGVAGAEQEVSRRMAAYKPLFTLMANSIVFPEKWAAPNQGELSSPSESLSSTSSLPHDQPPSLAVTLAVSFVITWALGLAPPLLIRHAIIRRPLSEKSAAWIAGGFSVFFWLAFLELNQALGQKPGTGVVWIIIFGVGRWIMSRGYVSPSGEFPSQVQRDVARRLRRASGS